MATLSITLELGGGTEFLTATKKTKKHSLQVPSLVVPNEFVKETQTPAVVEGALAAPAAAPVVAQTKRSVTMQDFIQFVCLHLIVERQGMLVEPDWSLRPGILVLINDADWELEGEMEYELQDGDHICLISTLHGG